MPTIDLHDITKEFGSFAAVDNLSLHVEDGDFITLLGPSGCGKTTTLRQIAGLETPTSGEISINGRIVFSSTAHIDVPPAERGVGFLFQNYALWPHMTVYQNIAFGLENLKWDTTAIRKRVDELLDLLRIREFPDRYPAELSGGQQQRVAIARTLATNPKVLLMDEPLSNLDAKLRMEMRAELKRLHHETGATFVYVTHDQQEAMTLATKICLLDKGKLQQFAPPLEVYSSPANVFVADFVGNPPINFLHGVCTDSKGDHLEFASDGMKCLFEMDGGKAIRKGEKITVGVRPEYINLVDHGVPATVVSSLPSGMETTLRVEICGKKMFTSVLFGLADYHVGTKVHIAFPTSLCIMFDDRNSYVGKGKLTFLEA